ncbi:60S ribosomal subunit assembly/export protein loc1 [Pseudocercospora fuligena]|uniref:60S ribosomal subunit assembly/export protein loc1 n=1 Tax=Pseudocercospora fuligena TaxID=685502 RepID=A0A8H6R9V7_9PEZI|nr:60S ribosomal subunit assembly/export protein loc1 [Pseudocercospora fuligena]
MAPVAKGKSAGKGSAKSGASGSSKPKSKTGPKPKPTEHKPKSNTKDKKKLPPHKRYTEKELKVPQLNGIRPAGVQKPPNAKKGKNFVDDKESMNAIMAMVMAEKEGNIESKMMRARQMEEVREARRLEAEKRAGEKKQKMDDRKQDIKNSKKRRRSDGDATTAQSESKPEEVAKKSKKKRVSFG